MTKMFRDVGKDMNPLLPLEGKRRWNPIRKRQEKITRAPNEKAREDTSLENTRTCNLFSHYDLRTSGACLGWHLGKIIALTKVHRWRKK